MGMTYRPNKNVLKAMGELKKKLKIKTNSKVLDFVLLNFLKRDDELKKALEDKALLHNQLYKIKTALLNKNTADKEHADLIKSLSSEW